jgi:protein-tyrosine phosphatase
MAEVLVLCTANRCRSPMAAALLDGELRAAGAAAAVRSAGFLGAGWPAAPEAVAAMAGYGIDLGPHRSRQVTAGDVGQADLVLAAAREHLRQAIVLDPGAFPRAFTLRELVRRGSAAGPRAATETMASWLARVHAGRQRSALLGGAASDDIADPMGGPPDGYRQAAAGIGQLVRALTVLCWPVG